MLTSWVLRDRPLWRGSARRAVQIPAPRHSKVRHIPIRVLQLLSASVLSSNDVVVIEVAVVGACPSCSKLLKARERGAKVVRLPPAIHHWYVKPTSL